MMGSRRLVPLAELTELQRRFIFGILRLPLEGEEVGSGHGLEEVLEYQENPRVTKHIVDSFKNYHSGEYGELKEAVGCR